MKRLAFNCYLQHSEQYEKSMIEFWNELKKKRKKGGEGGNPLFNLYLNKSLYSFWGVSKYPLEQKRLKGMFKRLQYIGFHCKCEKYPFPPYNDKT